MVFTQDRFTALS